MREETDVLVVGGGPAGATAATLLARQGHQVRVLERERFPRYHIGESLLPSLLPVLDVLGAREVIEAHGFVRKTGAFYGWGGQEWSLDFDQPHRPAAYSFQVIRSQFDQLLLEHACTQGADVRQEVRAGRITFEGGSGNGQGQRAVEATWTGQNGTEGCIRFGHLVDASGRAGLLAARQLRTRRVHDVFRNVATWSYWHGAAPLATAPSGAIGVFSLPDHGWLWAIPLHDGTLSVGLVTDKRSLAHARQTADGSLQTVYEDAIARCPRLAGMLTNARQTAPLKTESDYSYVSDSFTGPGWFLAGDAACFLDPLLSTGVHLAMYSGLLAAASINSVLRGDVDETAARAFYQTAYQHAYERLLILVSAFYRIHDGRDHYFRTAQQLSRRDQEPLRLHESFLNIITGAEDLHDTQTDDVVGTFLNAVRQPVNGRFPQGLAGHGTSDLLPLPTTSAQAAAGLYLNLHPHPHLRTDSGTGHRPA
ncbi:FAD-binding protein [Streptomyces sp. Ru73]|uniref:NAD(P)/FAD-dependent oxidoreductase n=1 Tax=Streptomyces sp. Ru73 TaxID=2080748 RepID=UPI000CDD83C8|nr:FAD-dependent oxidoreductase [Streptomyces sp. Ru73]POX36229.1 FAD-binding protein [Streptomyces sp. Ru73]